MDRLKFPVILRLLLPMILGVIVHFYTEFSVPLSILLVLLLALLIQSTPLVSRQKKSNTLFLVNVSATFFFLGGYLASVHKSNLNENYFMKYAEGWQNAVVRITEPPEIKENSVKCIVKVLQTGETNTMGKSLIYVQKDSASVLLNYGDVLVVNTRFNPIKSNGNPKEFDYSRYLRIHDIHEQAYIKSDKWKKIRNESNNLFRIIYSWRNHLSGIIQNSNMSEKNSMVANALLLGQKEYLDKDTLRSYSSAGAMHVLAVSGLHVGIVMLILTTLVSPIKRYRQGKTLFVVLTIIGIWLYALITGMSPSVMRAAVMFTFIVIGNELERDTTIYQSILVSAFFLILIEPYIIFQVGFQLSYLAVLGIVYLQPKIENLIYIKNKILFKAWQISAVSIAAQIATFPLGLYYFHQFPNFFLLSNLIVIPLAFVILIVGITYLTFHLIPFFGDILFWLFDSLLSILNLGVEWVERLPFSIVWGISIEWYEVFLIYLTILLGSTAFIKRKFKLLVSALAGCIILLGLNIYERQRLSSENVICVYNINDEIAIDVFNGQDNFFFSSQKLLNDEEKMLFHIKHNWFYRTGQESPGRWKNIESTRYMKFGQNLLAILNQNSLNQIPRVPYILLHNINFLPEDHLKFWKQNQSTLILGPEIKYNTRNFIKAHYPSSQLHDLQQDGAFEFYF